MNIKAFQAIYPNLSLVTSNDSFFGSMKHQYPEFVKSGFFHKSARAAIYIYQIVTEHRKYTAVIASNDLQDIEDHKILKHEETLAAKEQSMMQLILQRDAMIKPVLLAYDGHTDINAFIETELQGKLPFFNLRFDETNEEHILYALTDDAKIDQLQKLFKKHVPKCYIADGHHRVTTTMILSKGKHYRKEGINNLLCVYFPFEELDIYDYNRAVEIRDEISDAKLVASLSQCCKIKPLDGPAKPNKKHSFTMLLDGDWYQLKWKKKILDQYADQEVLLDAELLNNHVLDDIMHIEDIKTSMRMKYIAGTLGVRGVEKAVRGEQRKVGFCLYPVHRDELKQVADHGLNLPPKSTWFEPRIKNGVISQAL